LIFKLFLINLVSLERFRRYDSVPKGKLFTSRIIVESLALAIGNEAKSGSKDGFTSSHVPGFVTWYKVHIEVATFLGKLDEFVTGTCDSFNFIRIQRIDNMI